MPSSSPMFAQAEWLVKTARALGADAAEVTYAGGANTSVQVRMGQLEGVERSEGHEMGLRLFVGQSSASASTSDLSRSALTALAERTLAMARITPPDPYSGLAPQDRLARGPVPDLDMDDGCEMSAEALKACALEMEGAALAMQGISNSGGAQASSGRTLSIHLTSHGVATAEWTSSHGQSVSVLAQSADGAMERDYAFHNARHAADLEGAAVTGRRAGVRALDRRNPVRLKSGAIPIFFSPRVSASLIGHLIGAITGSAIARRSSFLQDALGARLFAETITILEDPLRRRGLRSRAIDGEGIACSRRALIENGVLPAWIAESASARQLGIAPTGHASPARGGNPGVSVANVTLAPGPESPEQLMADVAEGLYVTELAGQGVNLLTGDYSRGASGRRIVNGALAEAVSEVTIAGSLRAMFAALRPASDLDLRYGIDAPTIRIDGMTLAGA